MKPNISIETDIELTVLVEAEVGGRYIPASMAGPAEYPGVDDLRITLGGIDITDVIETQTTTDLEQEIMDEYHAAMEAA